MVPKKSQEKLGLVNKVVPGPRGSSVSMGTVNQTVTTGARKADIATDLGGLVATEAMDHMTVQDSHWNAFENKREAIPSCQSLLSQRYFLPREAETCLQCIMTD